MRIETKRLDELHPAEYNPRKTLRPGDKKYEKLNESIQNFGYVEPIVWNEASGRIVGGHQRYTVLLAQGFSEAQVVVVNLNDNDEKILNAALNRIQGRWDTDKLVELLEELKEQGELEPTGFEEWELDAMQVTYDHIEDLLADDFSDTGKSAPDGFTMTFTLPADVKEATDTYLDENPQGKEELAQLIVNKVKGVI